MNETKPETNRLPWTKLEIAGLAAILVLAVGVRCYRLGDESLWHDETASIQYMDAPSLAKFIELERPGDPAMVPLYFTLEYYVWRAVPSPILVCRLMSILFGVATIAVLHAAGRRMFGRAAGLTAAGCAAVAIQQVYYSQEIRMYAIYLFGATLAMYALLRILEGGRRGWWVVHLAGNAMMVWSHLFGVWLLVAQGLIVLVAHRRNLKMVVGWGLIQMLVVAPAALWVLSIDRDRIEDNLNWIPTLDSDMVREFLTSSALSVTDHVPASDPEPRWDEALNLPTVAKVLIAVAWLVLVPLTVKRKLRERRRLMEDGRGDDARKVGVNLGMVLAWLVVPSVILLALTFTWRPSFLPRYVLHSTMALYLLMGAAVASMKRAGVRWAVALVLIGSYAYDMAAFGLPRRPDMGTAMALVIQEAKPETTKVLVHPSGYQGPARFYTDLPEDGIKTCKDWRNMPDRAKKLAQNGKDCWLIVGALQGTPPNLAPLLDEKGLAYEYTHVAGAFPLRVYQVK
ncbi:MAG: hypothetical protein GY851_12235 [bacterium]|nr:hypothetical protein [bacterium]